MYQGAFATMTYMDTDGTFLGHRAAPLGGRIWRAGGPNSAVTARFARVRVPSPCLAEGSEYELEGALAIAPPQARALAVVQDLRRVKVKQYGPPVNRLLYERRQPKMTCIEPQGIVALWADEADPQHLGNGRPVDLEAEAEARRRLVGDLRLGGWDGAIVLPGFNENTRMVIVPRRHLKRLMVQWRGELAGPVPPGLVDFSLGLRRDFPAPQEIGALPLELPRQRRITHSWRPSPVPGPS